MSAVVGPPEVPQVSSSSSPSPSLCSFPSSSSSSLSTPLLPSPPPFSAPSVSSSSSSAPPDETPIPSEQGADVQTSPSSHQLTSTSHSSHLSRLFRPRLSIANIPLSTQVTISSSGANDTPPPRRLLSLVPSSTLSAPTLSLLSGPGLPSSTTEDCTTQFNALRLTSASTSTSSTCSSGVTTNVPTTTRITPTSTSTSFPPLCPSSLSPQYFVSNVTLSSSTLSRIPSTSSNAPTSITASPSYHAASQQLESKWVKCDDDLQGCTSTSTPERGTSQVSEMNGMDMSALVENQCWNRSQGMKGTETSQNDEMDLHIDDEGNDDDDVGDDDVQHDGEMERERRINESNHDDENNDGKCNEDIDADDEGREEAVKDHEWLCIGRAAMDRDTYVGDQIQALQSECIRLSGTVRAARELYEHLKTIWELGEVERRNSRDKKMELGDNRGFHNDWVEEGEGQCELPVVSTIYEILGLLERMEQTTSTTSAMRRDRGRRRWGQS